MLKITSVAHYLLALALLALPLSAQDTICSFDWYSNAACAAHLECIDNSWNGSTQTVPSNVTRIDENGLSLCLNSMAGVSDADIIYIVDLSASMNTIGDPSGKRPQALAAGFDYQVANVPNSRAGYIGFASSVITQGFTDPITGDVSRGAHLLPPVVAGSGSGQLQSQVQTLLEHVATFDAGSAYKERFEGTNYQAALAQAITWINDQSITPHDNQAIVFFSDGRPFPADGSASPTEEQLAFLESAGVRVHGIFMGDLGNCSPNPNQPCLEGTELKGLSTRTQGTYFQVDANRPDTLAGVVRQIVEGITADYTLASLTVSNGTQTVNQKSATQQNGTWSIVTDGIVPLVPGANAITLNADFTSAAGDTSLNFTFTLAVDGGANPACVTCRPVTTVQALGLDGMPVSSLSFIDKSYRIRLTYYGTDTLNTVTVALSTGKGDSESLTLVRTTAAGIKPAIYETVVALAVADGGSAVAGNTITESNNADTISLVWVHPADPRDAASRAVPVTTPRAATPVATPAGQTYFGGVSVQLTTATLGAVIYYTLDGTDPGLVAGQGGTLYAGSIPINDANPITITARAYRETMEPSTAMVEVYTNGDPVGPVITSVKYYLGNPPGSSRSGDDTLIITFDEPASCADLARSAQNVFRYVAGPIQDETTVLSGSNMSGCSGYTDKVVIILAAPGLVVPVRDSLAIKAGALSDSLGMRSVSTAPVVIRYGRSYDIIISSAPNPADLLLADPQVFAQLRGLVAGGESLPPTFSLVKVISVDSVVTDPGKTWMAVYDAMGNRIADNLPAYSSVNDPRTVYFAWDLRNGSGRHVGTGTYLGIATINLSGKGTKVRRQKIAVVSGTGRQK